MTNQPTTANWAGILILGVIWGGTFMVVRIALDGYGPFTVAASRTSLGAIALLAMMVIMRRPLPVFDRVMIAYLVVIGLLNTALPFALLSWGQQYVPSAFAGLSMAALPLFVLPLAHFLSDESLTRRSFLGVILGFCGAFVLIGPSALQIGSGVEPLGQLACLAAALSYAISSVLTRRCPPIDPISMAALLLLIGAIALLPAMLIYEGLPQYTDMRSTWAIILLGLIPTAFAALLRVTIIRTAGAVFLTLVNYQVPIWAMLMGALILNEALPWRFFAALALILCGLAISQWPSLRRFMHPITKTTHS
jgi:drug/metabolite transporter (DMT)-like permease